MNNYRKLAIKYKLYMLTVIFYLVKINLKLNFICLGTNKGKFRVCLFISDTPDFSKR